MSDKPNLQDLTRDYIRAMTRLTGWSPSRLAQEAGLAASTLHRFLNKPVKHSLSQKTMALLVIATVKKVMSRLEGDEKDLSNEFIDDIVFLAPLVESLFSNELNSFYEEGAPDKIGSDRFYAGKVVDFFKAVSDGRKKGIRKTVINHVASTLDDPAFSPLKDIIDKEDFADFLSEQPELRNYHTDSRDTQHDIAPAVARYFAKIGADRLKDSVKRETLSPDIPVLFMYMEGTDIKNMDFAGTEMKMLRPSFLSSSKNAFVVVVVGHDMMPKFLEHSRLFVNPSSKVEPGHIVIAESITHGLIGGFLKSISDTDVKITIPRTGKALVLPKSDVLSISRIIGSLEPG